MQETMDFLLKLSATFQANNIGTVTDLVKQLDWLDGNASNDMTAGLSQSLGISKNLLDGWIHHSLSGDTLTENQRTSIVYMVKLAEPVNKPPPAQEQRQSHSEMMQRLLALSGSGEQASSSAPPAPEQASSSAPPAPEPERVQPGPEAELDETSMKILTEFLKMSLLPKPEAELTPKEKLTKEWCELSGSELVKRSELVSQARDLLDVPDRADLFRSWMEMILEDSSISDSEKDVILDMTMDPTCVVRSDGLISPSLD